MNDYNFTELDKAKKFISFDYSPNENTRSRRLTKIADEGALNIRTLRHYRQNPEALDKGRWAIVHELSRQYDNEKLLTEFQSEEVNKFMQLLASCLTTAKITADFGQKLTVIISNEPAILYELITAVTDPSLDELLGSETLADIKFDSSQQLLTEPSLAKMYLQRDDFSPTKISRRSGIGIGALNGYAKGTISLTQASWANIHILAKLEVDNAIAEKNVKYQEFQEMLREFFLINKTMKKSNRIATTIIEKVEAIFCRKELNLMLYQTLELSIS